MLEASLSLILEIRSRGFGAKIGLAHATALSYFSLDSSIFGYADT